MHGRGPVIAPTWHTGDLTEKLCSPYQPSQSRTGDALLFGDAALGGPGQHQFHRPQIPVKLLSLWLWEPRAIKRQTRNKPGRFRRDRCHIARWVWQKRIGQRRRENRCSIRREQGQRKFAIKRELL